MTHQHTPQSVDSGIVTLTSSAWDRPRALSARHVLISEPQVGSYMQTYLPVMWGVLKTYWERHSSSPDLVNWHRPLYRMDPPQALVEPLADTPIDVLGLSCYTWNWRLQREVARLIKQSHPDCLVIAGGPHPDYRNPDFFDENPFIDAVVVKNGEVPFTRILQRTLSFPTMRDFHRGGLPLDDIPGLCLPHRPGEMTAAPESPARYDISNYLAQREYYEQFIQDHPGGVVVAWETSRGCPFRCSYCDWGSSTMSKVTRFDMDRLNNEIEWFARSGVRVLFSVDSNFGMFKSDVDITDAIVRAKEEHGSPVYFVYSNAKNVPKRTVEITRKVVSAGLDTAHTLSVQHSSIEVLEATDRENISIEKQIQVVRELQEDGIPISVQLILGLPKDTPELWRKTFTDLMEWGIHDGYTITNYHLLPNAPASMPEYREKWGIKGVERFIYDGSGVMTNTPVDPLTFARGEVIVSTSSFTHEDWVRMSVESVCIRALHNTGITQLIARYLRCTHGITYHELYSGFMDSFLPGCIATQDVIPTLSACFERFLVDEMHICMLPMPGVIGTDQFVEPHRWAYATLCQRSDAFYDALTRYLTDRYPQIVPLQSLCAYQRALLIKPAYDPTLGLSVSIDHDWPEYFLQTETIIPDGPVSEPAPLTDSIMLIRDTGWDDGTGRGGFNWPVGVHEDAWKHWFNTIATNRLSAKKCNHQSLSIQGHPSHVAMGICGQD